MKELETILKELEGDIERAAANTVKVAGDYARTSALSTTKFKVSDTFRAATQFHSLDQFSGFVLADKDYAFWLEEGNNQQGSRIYPKNAKALHWKSGGKDVFAKSVKAHGPYNFMSDAADQLDEHIEELFLEELQKLIGE
jgi:hypothetical protein